MSKQILEKYNISVFIPKQKVFLKTPDLEEGGIYLLHARNFNVGIWDGECFEGIRKKFGREFLDREIHWDLDAVHGTAQPVAKLGDVYE